MKKYLFIAILLAASCINSVQAQVPSDTAALRAKILSDIVTNGSKSITAKMLQDILVGVSNLMNRYSLDSAYLSNDTIYLTGPGITTITIKLPSGAGGTETDPTVPSAVKAITSSDISNWNSKQSALTGSATIDIVANIVTAKNSVAQWNSDKIQGRSVSSTAPATGQLLGWNGTTWIPVDPPAGGGGVTDLSYTPSATNGVVTSSTGTDATIPAADGTNAGLLKPADYNLLQDSVITNVSKIDSITVYRTKSGKEVFRDTTRTSHGIGTIVDSVVYPAPGSIDTLTFSKLVDKTALSVEVHPYVLHLTSTTPGTDEVQVNATTGGVKFGTALTSGQTVTILYKYTVTDGTAAVTTVNSQTGDVVIDGSETKLAEGANITITGTGTVADPYTLSSSGGGSSNLDLGSTDSTYYLLAGVIQPTFDTATNTTTWSWIKNSAHTNLNFKDSFSVTGSYVGVYFKNHTSRVVSFLVVPDESTSNISRTTASYQGKSGAIYYTNGPYYPGSRVFNDSAYIYFSKFGNLSARLSWNGSAWSWTNDNNNLISFSSPAPTVTWTSGKLDISNLSFSIRKTPSVSMYSYAGNVDSLLAYHPSLYWVSPTRVILNFWDIRNNQKLTLATPPTNFGVYLDFGASAGIVNPSIEDFGPASNFWVIAVMKKNDMNHFVMIGLIVTLLMQSLMNKKRYC